MELFNPLTGPRKGKWLKKKYEKEEEEGKKKKEEEKRRRRRKRRRSFPKCPGSLAYNN